MVRVLLQWLVLSACMISSAVANVPTLDPVNVPPTITQNAGTVYIQLTGIYAGDPNQMVRSVDVSSSNRALLQARVTFTAGATTAMLSLEPQAGQSGEATITILVIDDAYEASTTSFTVTISPAAMECQYTEWSAWSECSRVCNGGTQTRTRSVVAGSDNDGRPCNELEETLECNRQACPEPTLDPITDRSVVQDTPGVLEVYLTGISGDTERGQALAISATTRDNHLLHSLRVDYQYPDSSAGLGFQLHPAVTGTATVSVTVVVTHTDTKHQSVPCVCYM
jgi:hypothetical protein